MKQMRRRKRTSDTDPLRIAWVSAPCPDGHIGLTLCPGKKQRDGVFAQWERDLAKDLAVVRDSDATALVSLIEQVEIKALGIPSLGEDAEGLGLEWHRLPVRDMGTPDEIFETRWTYGGHRLRRRLARGECVVLHCMFAPSALKHCVE